MRLFLAVNLSDELRGAVARATARAREGAPRASWIRPELLHITVKFIGERPDADVPRIAAIVAAAARQHEPFVGELSGAGAFPNFRAPRVVWIGMRQARPLESMARTIDASLAKSLGVEAERRPFRAHLTLARVKGPLPPVEATMLERAMHAVRARWQLPVHSIDIMQSQLSSSGPRYTCLDTIPLGGGA